MLRSLGVVALAVALLELPATANDLVLVRLDQYLDALRQQAGIKGLAAAIVQDGTVAWERGYGLSDVENTVATRPDTPFVVGGLTQMLSATLALRCAESGTLSLDEPMVTFSRAIPEPTASVRHVLAHTSNGQPGTVFAFDPGRFSALTPAIERCAGTGFREALYRGIFARLGMVDTVPARDLRGLGTAANDDDDEADGRIDGGTLAQWNAVLTRLAKPYKVDKNGRTTPGGPVPESESGANASTGVVSTVRDLAKFDTALDDGVLLRPESLAAIWSNQVLNDGRPTPAGLGWFVQAYNGERVVWQYSALPEGYSSLVLRLPSRQVSVILLANTDGLAADIPLFDGDIRVSPFARLFLQLFI